MISELTRRQFLATSAAALSSAGLAHLVPQKRAEPVNAAFIGVGSQGQTLLKRALRIPGVTFTRMCDIYPPHLNKAIQMCEGTAKGCEDYREVLDDKSIDAVLIATPLHLHAKMSIDALEAGKQVFSEKCMARWPEQARDMCRAVERTGKWLQIGHQRRSSALYPHAVELVQEDDVLGRLTHARCFWHRNGSWRRDVPPEYERLLNWRLYNEYSGGLMTELGSHQVHVVNWFTGQNPVSVTGFGGIDYWKDGREVFDNVCCTFEYPDGVKLMYSSLTTNQFEGYGELLMGDKGTLTIDAEKGRLFKEPRAKSLPWAGMAEKETVGGREAIVLDATATKRPAEGERHGAGAVQAAAQDDYMAELVDFFDLTVRRNRRPKCDHVDGLRAAVAVLGANKAMETRTRVDFKPEDFEYKHEPRRPTRERITVTSGWIDRRMPR
jgi:predicted dehydrogenase